MRKIIIIILPILFTAQACNFLFGDLYGEQPTGSRGVFLSTDSGATWQEAGKVSKDKTLAQASVARVVIENAKPNNLLAASLNEGVYATDTSGEKWFSLLPNFAAYDAFINPHNSEEILVGGARSRLAVILKSADRGNTWVQIYTEPTGQAAVTALIYDPQNPQVFYAGLSSGTILKSSDGGLTWNALTDFQDRVVKLALSVDGRTLYLLGRDKGLSRSQDLGKTWTSTDLPERPSQHHDLFVDQTDASIFYVGTDKGLFRTLDGGGKWDKLFLPATPEVNNVTAVAVNPRNSRQIFAAIRSTVYRSDDSGATWSVQALPTRRIISSIAIDPQEPNRVYVGVK